MSEHSYQTSVRWAAGEHEAFAASFFDGDFWFYVPNEALADYQRRAPTMSPDEWQAIFSKGGFVAQVGLAYAPRALAFAHFEHELKQYPDHYLRVAGLLARFGVDAVPLVLAQLPQHAVRALNDLAPIDAAEVAPVLAAVLVSNENSKTKQKAERWLERHPEAAAAGLVNVLLSPSATEHAAATTALTWLATQGHSASLLTAARSLGEPTFEAMQQLVKQAPSRRAASAPTHLHAARVSYAAHHVTPLVIGDFEVMKRWRGLPEGLDEVGLVDLAGGRVLVTELDQRAPEVYVDSAEQGRDIILVASARSQLSVRDQFTEEEIQRSLTSDWARTFGSWSLEVTSAALVIAVALNATPPENADPSELEQLDSLCFHEGTPRLPARAPTTILDRRELLVLPVSNGTYQVTDGEVGGLLRCTIRLVK